MTTQELRRYFTSYVDVTEDQVDVFLGLMRHKKIPNRKFLLKEGDICNRFSFVVKGCLMNYVEDQDKNTHVLQFATKDWWTADLKSLIRGLPSSYYIRATVDSEVLQISFEDIDRVSEEIPQFQQYFRILFQNALIAHQERIISGISESAEARYQEFLRRYPDVMQLVPLKYIASYLGITPEFLSKIRRNMAHR